MDANYYIGAPGEMPYDDKPNEGRAVRPFRCVGCGAQAPLKYVWNGRTHDGYCQACTEAREKKASAA